MARKTFTFRLQKLLDIRLTREKLAEQELVTRRMALAAEHKKMQQIEQREQDIVDRMDMEVGRAFDIEERWQCERWLVQLRKQKEMQSWAVDAAQQKVDEQLEVVKQARMDVKSLEKLKEKKQEEFHEEQLREEAVFLDDLAGQQFIRQQKQRDENAALAQLVEEG